ncbi:hypothetical protein V5799_004382, partial [Amblyomma americanum]
MAQSARSPMQIPKKNALVVQSMWGFNVPYRCAHCKLRFLEDLELVDHHKRQHGLKPQSVENWNPTERSYGSASAGPNSSVGIDYGCFLCGAPTTSWDEISAHIVQEHDRSVCRNCGRLFVSEAALQSHRKNMHDPKFGNHDSAQATFGRNATSNTVTPSSRLDEEKRSSGEEDKASSAAQAGHQDCSLCGRSEGVQPQGSNGVYTCPHCEWTTLSLARLRLHHLEDHDNGELTKLLQQAGPSDAVASGTSASLAGSSRGLQRDDAGPSAIEVDDSAADAYSSDDTILASCPSADDDSDFEDEEELDSDDEVTSRITKRPEVTCPYCDFTCVMASSLRRHHALKHAEMPLVESHDRDARRKRPSSTRLKQVPRKARAGKCDAKMYGYKRDGFVCSDNTSGESSQDECGDEDIASAALAVPSPLSDGDASWHPSEVSGDRKKDDSSSDSSEDDLSSVCCEECGQTFATKLKLAVHMAKLHKLHYFCFHCGRASKQVELLRLHHRRVHRKHPFKYLTLDGLKLVTVARVDSGKNEEHTADESTCLVGKSAQRAVKHWRRSSTSKSHAKTSFKQRSVSRSPTEKPHSAPRRRKKFLISSSSDEEEGFHKPETVRSISRIVYSGYRCAKSVDAFHQLMTKISDEFKCSAFSCGFSTNSASDFEEHLRGHNLADVFCIYCGTDVASPEALIAHLRQAHGSLQHQCSKCLYRSVCRKGCQSAAALLQHLQEHGFANVQCGYCSFGTGSTGAMMLHSCYCHSDLKTVFRVRSEDIGEELINHSEMGVR